ncbi:MAG: hypothetical protein R3D78_04340 [Paracoccaceae bacterium]
MQQNIAPPADPTHFSLHDLLVIVQIINLIRALLKWLQALIDKIRKRPAPVCPCQGNFQGFRDAPAEGIW